MPSNRSQALHNAKGRQSSGGQRKKGKIKKRKSHTDGEGEGTVPIHGGDTQVDPNADILVPKSKEEKDKERKAKLLKEVSIDGRQHHDSELSTGIVAARADGGKVDRQEEEATGEIHCQWLHLS
jgi:hypothetical protein